METRKFFTVLFLIFTFIPSLIKSQPALQTRFWSKTLGHILDEIIQTHFSQCDIVFLQDSYFSSHLNSLVVQLGYPSYVVQTDNRPIAAFSTFKKITKSTGFFCTSFIVTCLTFKNCRTEYSATLFEMLNTNAALRQERRAVVYVHEGMEEYTEADDEHSRLKNKTLEGHKRQAAMTNSVKILQELQPHIILVQNSESKNHLEESQIYQGTDYFYATTSFSPNFFPGQMPIFRNVWSLKRGFLLPVPLLLKISHMKPGGMMRFCVIHKDLLPTVKFLDNGDVEGLEGELIKLVARRFQFRWKYIEALDEELGGKDPTSGRWTGVIGMIFRKEADFGIGQMVYSQSRFKSGLQFSPGFITLNLVAVCPLPELLPRFYLIISPFRKFIWVGLIIATSISVGFISALQRFINRYMQPKPKATNTTWESRGGGIRLFNHKRKFKAVQFPWLHSIGPLFLKSVPEYLLPRNWSVLVYFSVWISTSFVISCTYVTILITLISFPLREPYIKTVPQLVRSKSQWSISPLTAEVVNNAKVYTWTVLRSKAEMIQNLPEYADIPPDEKVYSYINRTKNCAVGEETRSKYIIGRDFTASNGDRFMPQMYLSRPTFAASSGWAMRTDLDFLLSIYFDRIFLEFNSFGFDLKEVKSFYSTSFDQNKHETITIEPLDYETCGIIFLCMLIGLSFSFLVFLCEIFYGYKSKRTIFYNKQKLIFLD